MKNVCVCDVLHSRAVVPNTGPNPNAQTQGPPIPQQTHWKGPIPLWGDTTQQISLLGLHHPRTDSLIFLHLRSGIWHLNQGCQDIKGPVPPSFLISQLQINSIFLTNQICIFIFFIKFAIHCGKIWLIATTKKNAKTVFF